eukprot:393788-Pyramimonas_sp.AAC.1
MRSRKRHQHKLSEVRATFLDRCQASLSGVRSAPGAALEAPPGGPGAGPRDRRGAPKVYVCAPILLDTFSWRRLEPIPCIVCDSLRAGTTSPTPIPMDLYQILCALTLKSGACERPMKELLTADGITIFFSLSAG